MGLHQFLSGTVSMKKVYIVVVELQFLYYAEAIVDLMGSRSCGLDESSNVLFADESTFECRPDGRRVRVWCARGTFRRSMCIEEVLSSFGVITFSTIKQTSSESIHCICCPPICICCRTRFTINVRQCMITYWPESDQLVG